MAAGLGQMGTCSAHEGKEMISVLGNVLSAVLVCCRDSGIMLTCCISNNLVNCRLCSIVKWPFTVVSLPFSVF